jgi:hypothetical protein
MWQVGVPSDPLAMSVERRLDSPVDDSAKEYACRVRAALEYFRSGVKPS